MSRWTSIRPVVVNVVVVTLVSLLIWLWAAGRTREVGSVRLLVRFVGDPGHMLALPTESVPIDVELQGARRDLDIAEQRLSGTTIALKAGRFGIPGGPGIHAVDLALALSRSDEIDREGISVLSTSPATTTLTLLETETITATIVPSVPGAQLSGPAVAEPDTTRVTLPKALVAALGSDPHVIALVPAAQANAQQPGHRHSLEAVLRVPESIEDQAKLVRMSPESARVSFTLTSRLSPATLRLVPVQVAGPPEDLAGYQVTIDPDDAFLRDVEVSGPSETIRALEDGRAKAFAFVHLSADDLALRVTRKRIDLWMLPSGVTVTRIGESTDALPAVRLTVKPR